MSRSLRGDGLKAIAVRGSVWTLAGNGANHAVRLVSNLILTRLLFPAAFGLMALVQTITQGLNMFSNAGLLGSVIHHERGDDPQFLQTVWTVQAIRGIGLWLVACLVAAAIWALGSMSLFSEGSAFAAPQLPALLLVSGFGMVLSGLKSVSMLQSSRHIQVGRLVTLELAAKLVGLPVMIVHALIWPSVWALVSGALASGIALMIASHLFLPGPPARFHWDRHAARELFRFGRWVLLGSAVAFLAGKGDRFVLGQFISAEQFGVYAIAVLLAGVVGEVVSQWTRRVLFPVYARLNDRGEQHLRQQVIRLRAVTMAILSVPILTLAIGGQWFVELLYDQRYTQAGWILQILALGIIGSVVDTTSAQVLLAKGDSFKHMSVRMTRLVFTIAGMAVGAWLGGFFGLVCGLAASRWASYPVLALMLRRHGLWLPWLDAVAMLGCAALALLGIALTGQWPVPG